MNPNELYEAVAKDAKVSKNVSRQVINSMVDVIMSRLIDGKDAAIPRLFKIHIYERKSFTSNILEGRLTDSSKVIQASPTRLAKDTLNRRSYG